MALAFGTVSDAPIRPRPGGRRFTLAGVLLGRVQSGQAFQGTTFPLKALIRPRLVLPSSLLF